MEIFKNPKLLIILVLCQMVLINTGGIFDYSHKAGSELEIQAGSISSKKAIIPFGYDKLKICEPSKITKAEDTLGEILTGEILYSTKYKTKINEDEYCKILCYNNIDEGLEKTIKNLINRKYFTNWYLDKLQAGYMKYNQQKQKVAINYSNGVPLGKIENDIFYIFNHLQFHILVNKASEDKYNIVGFNILPLSIKHDETNPMCSKEGGDKMLSNLEQPPQPLTTGKVLFTYDIIYEKSDITLATRWDNYKSSNKSIHWTGIIISDLLICVFSGIIGFVLTRNIRQDIDSYNYRVEQLEIIDEYGWKQVAGDVFRAPYINKMLLCAIIGNGIQLFFMLAVTLCLGVFGFLNPEKRANLLNIGILFFCFMGLPGGYVSASIYKVFGGVSWLKNSIFTSILFPGILVFGYVLINIFLTIEKSNAAVRVIDIISLFILWIFCTFPLILIGSFLGVKSKRINICNQVNAVPSLIPEKPWYLHYRYLTFVTGLIGFATIFIELSYVMAALWNHQIYFLATFLWISFYLFVIVTGEVSVLVVYWNLCYGDYNWWWKSFIVGSSPVIYFVLYSIYYFFYLKVSTLAATVVYFGIMGLISAMAMLICGSTSVLITLGFLNKIYSSIKID